jgi:thiazole synthase
MAFAFRQAVEAGRTAFEIGIASSREMASATSPLDAFFRKDG